MTNNNQQQEGYPNAFVAQQEQPGQTRFTYYKFGIALEKGREGISSCLARDEWEIMYERGIRVERVTPLFAFETEADALDFADTMLSFHLGYEIWMGYSTMPPLALSQKIRLSGKERGITHQYTTSKNRQTAWNNISVGYL